MSSAGEFFLHGGGDFEDGEDGARAVTFSFAGMVEMAEAYAKYRVAERDKPLRELAGNMRSAALDCMHSWETGDVVARNQVEEWADELLALLDSRAKGQHT